MVQARKKANQQRRINKEMPPGFRRIPEIVANYSGTGYMTYRELVGNYPKQTMVHPKTKKPIFNYNQIGKNMKLLISYMKPHELPVLYKGFKGRNAENLRRNRYFNAKTPTSASTNKRQAESFAIPNGILLTLPAKTRLSIVQTNLVKARQPREKEVLLAPQRFELKNDAFENFKK
jgi:hypothetical protein